MTWSQLYRLSLISLVFALAVPFAAAAGYLLDISETADDDPSGRLIQLVHEDGREVFLKVTRHTLTVFGKNPQQGEKGPRPIPVLKMQLVEDKETGQIQGAYFFYDNYTEYLDLISASGTEIDMVLLDVIDQLMFLRDAEYWKALMRHLDDFILAGPCEEETVAVADYLFKLIGSSSSLSRLANFDYLIKQLRYSAQVCYPDIYPSPAGEK